MAPLTPPPPVQLLLRSNLILYPENNGMSVYGLGAIELYDGRIQEAHDHLVAACNMTSLAEPHILLSQLYWRYRSSGVGIARAQYELEVIENTTSPRKEVLTNLGMLLFTQQLHAQSEGRPEGDPNYQGGWMRKRSEYLIIAAHLAHGYPVGHPNIAILASNAGCMRMLSPLERYGQPERSAELFDLATEIGFTGAPTAFRNAASFWAVQGYADHAFSFLAKGDAALDLSVKSVKDAEAAGAVRAPDDATAHSNFINEHRTAIHRARSVLMAHRLTMAKWAAMGTRVVGEEAEQRLNLLGFDCVLELLWW